jgi:hypothetical protein
MWLERRRKATRRFMDLAEGRTGPEPELAHLAGRDNVLAAAARPSPATCGRIRSVACSYATTSTSTTASASRSTRDTWLAAHPALRALYIAAFHRAPLAIRSQGQTVRS